MTPRAIDARVLMHSVCASQVLPDWEPRTSREILLRSPASSWRAAFPWKATCLPALTASTFAMDPTPSSRPPADTIGESTRNHVCLCVHACTVTVTYHRSQALQDMCHPPCAWLVHRFDGDGMLHAVRIKGGKASYSNTYVKTAKLQAERRAGFPLALKVTSLPVLTGILCIVLLLMDAGPALHRSSLLTFPFGC